MSAADGAFMAQALALAALGEGRTSPNPRVGCLIVRDGVVVGRGWHRAAGQAHAEAAALAQAGEGARGATLYVNLEPCAHYGRTPPCAEMIVSAGVARVVASIRDPNPLVDGRGIARLREAGVVVETGEAAQEAERLNAAFLLSQRLGRPLVTLKAAASLDGRISAAGGRAAWITGEPARRYAQRLRLRHDAVLVGAGTARRDDPRLTVRLPGVAAARLRAVLAPGFDLDPRARLFSEDPGDGSPPPRIYGSEEAPTQAGGALARRCSLVRVPRGAAPGTLDLHAVLADLAREGAASVLVEGGGRTLAGFLEAGLADRIAVFSAPKLLGDAEATPLLDGLRTGDPEASWRVEEVRRLAIGADHVLTGRLVAPAGRA